MLWLHTTVHASACALLFLRFELPDAAASLVNHSVRPDVSFALDFVESQAQNIRWRLQNDANIFKSPEAKPTVWKHPWHYLQMWVSASAKAATAVRQLIYRAVVLDVQQLAQQVEKHTPKFDHFLNDKTFGRTLIRRHLLHNPYRDSLGKESVDLFHGLSQLGALNGTANSNLRTKGEATHDEIVDYARSVFASAKLAVTVTAAVHVCLVLSGPDQKAQATLLVQKKADELPKTLLAELIEKANLEPDCEKRSAVALEVASRRVA